MSAETRLSAWILGLLPVIVGGLIIMSNANYVMSMWRDPFGKTLIMAALGLELIGALALTKLAKSI